MNDFTPAPVFQRLSSIKLISSALLFFLTFAPLLGQEDVVIKKINFHGNKSIPGWMLKSKMTLKSKSGNRNNIYSEVLLRKDFERLRAFYITEGFLAAKVDTFEIQSKANGNRITLNIHLSEGDSVVVANLRYAARDSLTNAVIARTKPNFLLKTGRRYRDLALLADRETLFHAFANAGFPYVKITPRPELDAQNFKLNLAVEIDPGPHCAFDSVEVIGNQRVSDHLIQKQLAFKSGKSFSQKKINTSQANLYALGLFEFVTIHPLLENPPDSTLPVRIEVKEAPDFVSKQGIGWGAEDKFRVSVDAKMRWLGGGRLLNIVAKRSGLEPISLEAGLTQPSFLEDKTILNVTPFYKTQKNAAFEARRLGGTVSAQRKVAAFTTGFVNYLFEEVESRGDASAADSLEKFYNKSAVSAGFWRDTSAPLFSPTRGSYEAVTLTFSGLGLNSVKFARAVAEWRFFHKLHRSGLTAAIKVKAGYLKTFDDTEVLPREERFYVGGSNSVRGWSLFDLGPREAIFDTAGVSSLRPAGGKILSENSLELRFPIFGYFSGVAFFDFGNVWESKLSKLRY